MTAGNNIPEIRNGGIIVEWVIRFLAIWIIFILLVDWKELKINIWCGVFSIGLQLVIDTIFIKNGYYHIKTPIIDVLGSSLFFIIGPVFVAAMLLSQYQPSKKWMQVLYVIIFSVVYDIEEYLLLVRKELVYTNWTFLTSVIFNFILMASLSWFSIVVLKRGTKES